jgi:single-strand DNA-binding protein
MASFNKVILMGNVTRDPEVKYTAKGTAIAKLGLAVSRKFSTESGEKKEEVTFVDVDFIGKIAETVGKFVKKGDPIHIDGRLKLDQWEDKKTGDKRSKLGVLGEGMQFLSRPSGPPEGGGTNINRHRQQNANAPVSPRQAAAGVTNDGPVEADDDVPF